MTKLKMLASTAALILATTTSAFATECIAPANPGGGWDFTCRQIGKLLYDLKLVDAPVQVTNMAGAGGGLAFAHVVTDRDTNPDLIVAASSATTTRLAQNAFGGRDRRPGAFGRRNRRRSGRDRCGQGQPVQDAERHGRSDQERPRLGCFRRRFGSRRL